MDSIWTSSFWAGVCKDKLCKCLSAEMFFMCTVLTFKYVVCVRVCPVSTQHTANIWYLWWVYDLFNLVWLRHTAKIENYNSISTWSVSEHFDWTETERYIYIGWSESHHAMLRHCHTFMQRNGMWQQCDTGGGRKGKATVMMKMSLVIRKQPASFLFTCTKLSLWHF